MKITVGKEDNSEAAFEFLLKNENKCVSLISRILEKQAQYFVLFSDSGEVFGIIGLSRYGQLLPFFCEKVFVFEEEYLRTKEMIARFIEEIQEKAGRKLFCILGEKKSAELVIDVLKSECGLDASVEIEYELLEKSNDSVFCSMEDLEAEKKSEILAADFEMAEEIFPLQYEYEKEEVLIPGEVIEPKACKILLNKALINGMVYVLKAEGKIVSKLNINAHSMNYVQFGGVFTLPEFRGKKFAKVLVDRIAGKFLNEGKKICLFVKESNLAAKKLYSRCGFEKIGGFKICYY